MVVGQGSSYEKVNWKLKALSLLTPKLCLKFLLLARELSVL